MFIWYKNSILASVVSIVGCIFALFGIHVLVQEGTYGLSQAIPALLVSVPLVIWGKMISAEKSFDTWWNQIEKAGLIPEIKRSRSVAVDVYKKNPERRTLEKICKLNPDAAKYIENGYQEPTKSNAPQSTASQQNTIQKQSVKQTVEQPAVRQTAMQQPVKKASEQTINIEKLIDRVEQRALNCDKNTAVIWECLQELEHVYPQFPNHKRLCETIGDISFLYAVLKNTTSKMSHEDSRSVFNAARRSLDFTSNCTQKNLEYRYAPLFCRAVHGGISAGNSDKREDMEEALEWIRFASRYRITGLDDTLQYYVRYNAALPCVRTWLCYWLAVDYQEKSPQNIGKAREYINEALQHCPSAAIRQCDLNPWMEDTRVLLEKWHLVSRKDSIG